MTQLLKRLLKQIQINDTNYDLRNDLVLDAFGLAKSIGYETGIRFDKDSGKDWYVVFIVLPGDKEISWHLPCSKREYTGYSCEEKYQRCKDYCSS